MPRHQDHDGIYRRDVTFRLDFRNFLNNYMLIFGTTEKIINFFCLEKINHEIYLQIKRGKIQD